MQEECRHIDVIRVRPSVRTTCALMRAPAVLAASFIKRGSSQSYSISIIAKLTQVDVLSGLQYFVDKSCKGRKRLLVGLK